MNWNDVPERDKAIVRNTIDAFIASMLAKAGLAALASRVDGISEGVRAGCIRETERSRAVARAFEAYRVAVEGSEA